MAHFFILNGQKLTLVVLIVLFAITTTCFSATEASPTKTETGDGHDSAEVSTEGHNTEQMAELREAEGQKPLNRLDKVRSTIYATKEKVLSIKCGLTDGWKNAKNTKASNDESGQEVFVIGHDEEEEGPPEADSVEQNPAEMGEKEEEKKITGGEGTPSPDPEVHAAEDSAAAIEVHSPSKNEGSTGGWLRSRWSSKHSK